MHAFVPPNEIPLRIYLRKVAQNLVLTKIRERKMKASKAKELTTAISRYCAALIDNEINACQMKEQSQCTKHVSESATGFQI